MPVLSQLRHCVPISYLSLLMHVPVLCKICFMYVFIPTHTHTWWIMEANICLLLNSESTAQASYDGSSVRVIESMVTMTREQMESMLLVYFTRVEESRKINQELREENQKLREALIIISYIPIT